MGLALELGGLGSRGGFSLVFNERLEPLEPKNLALKVAGDQSRDTTSHNLLMVIS